MSVKCDIKIMASPKRYAHVLNACKVLGLDIDKDVFFDDRPGGGHAAYTSEKTWSLPFEDGITHRCVLQDDVLACRNFRDTLERIIAQKPDAVFTLFCPSGKLKEFYEGAERPLIVEIRRGGMYGPAIVMPRKYVDAVYDWGRIISGGREILHDDVLFGEFALSHSIKIFTTAPTIVQHICPDRSLLGYNDKRKVSKVFEFEVGSLEWEKADGSRFLSLPNSTGFFREEK